MMPNDQHNTPISTLQETQPAVYYCRACGGALPAGSKASFHAACRKRVKRERVARKRERETRRETRRFHTELRRLNCPDCGASLSKLVQPTPRCSVEEACDAAQRALEPLNSGERLDSREPATERAVRL